MSATLGLITDTIAFSNVDGPGNRFVVFLQGCNFDCVGCHVSQQDNHYTPATKTYATAWADFGTTCERCPGIARSTTCAAGGSGRRP